jgi:predicted MFS family arabinose efflux permease
MAGLAPDEMRGRYQGVMSISWSTATMIGPSMGIALYQASPVLVWAGTFVLAIVAAGLTLAGGRVGRSGIALGEVRPAER